VTPQRVAVTTSYDDDDDKEMDGSNKEHIATAERDFKRQA
jgi:hypothetical protein